MALTSALFTGLSGINVNQTRLNVVGNNISNVNTVGYKSSRAIFKPQFYVTDTPGSPASSEFGGENPSQRGLGAVVAAIQKDFTPGSIEPTGNPSDLAIDGEGFFVVQGDTQKYTRDGSFTLNQFNQLVTTGGEFVQGFAVDENENIIAGQLGDLTIPLGSLTRAQATENTGFLGNLNANGAVATGMGVLDSGALTTAAGTLPDATTLLTDLRNTSDLATPLFADGDVLTLSGKRGGRDLPDLAYTLQPGATVGDLSSFFNQGLGIDTTAPGDGTNAPGAVFTAIDATSGKLQVFANLGMENTLSLAGSSFTSSNTSMNLTFSENVVDSVASGESVFTSFPVYDSLGTALTINVTAVLESKTDAGSTWRFYATSPDDTDALAFDPAAPSHPGMIIGNGTLSFDNNGKLTGTTAATIQLNRDNTGADTPLSIALNFDKMTALTSDGSTLLMSEQDGKAIGTLTSFSIGADGTIIGAFDNGVTSTLGQLAMATFDNQQGLVDSGANMFTTGANSGVPKITAPLTLTAGAIRAGALEISNVDLSEEFINLIISSTGFSAASRVITTSDQLLTELLNSSR